MRSFRTREVPQQYDVPSPDDPASAPQGEEGLGDLEGDLEKVRQILVGWQVSALEERCRLLDQELRKLIGEQIATVERQVKNEIGAVKDRLSTEERERKSIDGNLLEKLGELSAGVGAKIASLREKAEQGGLALRDQMLSQSNLLKDAVAKRDEETRARLNRGLHDLRAAKTDRETLANLIMGVATRLKNEDEDQGDSDS